MEAEVGRIVRSMRQARGWSQEELARQMRDHGFTQWTQSTAAKTEAADRPIRVNEVYALARVFDTSVTSILIEQGRGGQIHSLLVAIDSESVAKSRRDQAARELATAEEQLQAARERVERLSTEVNDG